MENVWCVFRWLLFAVENINLEKLIFVRNARYMNYDMLLVVCCTHSTKRIVLKFYVYLLCVYA